MPNKPQSTIFQIRKLSFAKLDLLHRACLPAKAGFQPVEQRYKNKRAKRIKC
jgi:hypothetical protein